MRCISTHKWIWSRLCDRRVMRRHKAIRGLCIIYLAMLLCFRPIATTQRAFWLRTSVVRPYEACRKPLPVMTRLLSLARTTLVPKVLVHRRNLSTICSSGALDRSWNGHWTNVNVKMDSCKKLCFSVTSAVVSWFWTTQINVSTERLKWRLQKSMLSQTFHLRVASDTHKILIGPNDLTGYNVT